MQQDSGVSERDRPEWVICTLMRLGRSVGWICRVEGTTRLLLVQNLATISLGHVVGSETAHGVIFGGCVNRH